MPQAASPGAPGPSLDKGLDTTIETRRLTRLIIVLGVGLVALFVAAVVGTSLVSLNRSLDSSRMAADLIEDSVTRTLESTETTLLSLLAAVRAGGRGNSAAREDRLRGLIDQSLAFAPHLRQIIIADRDGRVLLDSLETSEGGVIDLAAMGLGEADGPAGDSPMDRGLRVGGETPGRFLPLAGAPSPPSPHSTIPVEVWTGGAIRVVAAINPASLRRTMGQALTGSSRTVALVRLDGVPLIEAMSGEGAVLDDGRAALAQAVAEGREGGLVSVGATAAWWPDGWLAFRLSSRYPAAIVVATAPGHAMLTLLEETAALLFWSTVVLVVFGAGVVVFLRESLRRMRLEGSLRLVGLTQAVFAHSSEPMLVTDTEGRVQAANPAFLSVSGLTRQAVTGQPADALLVPAWSPSDDDEQATPPDDATRPEHWWLKCADTPPRAVEYRAAPLSGAATIITLNDITERIETQMALQEALDDAQVANRAKSEFLAAMSHELRTPLNAIMGFSEIMRDELFGPVGTPQYRSYLADIHASGSHLRDIIDDLLDLARIEAGRLTADIEHLDVNEEIAICCRLVQERATNHGLTLGVVETAEPPDLFADRRLLRQMLFNLLSNAIKFTPRGGSVTVTARRTPDGPLRVAVSDTGIGITPEDQARVFESYHRAANTTVRRIEGSGLGLSLVQAMVELHGGAVTVQSVVGQGSTFTLVFPREAAEGETSPAPLNHET